MKLRVWRKTLPCGFGKTVWKWIQIVFTFFLVIKKIHQVDICSEKLSSTCCEKLLVIKIDDRLTFEEHVDGLCKRASQRVSAVARTSSLMRISSLIVNSFITSHFSDCALVWMFHSRRLSNRFNYIHERALRIIYQDYNSSFKKLLKTTTP